MDPISIEDLALLDVLTRIFDGVETGPVDSAVEERLLASGLIKQGSEGLSLSAAGVAMCKSLQHRVAADKLAEEAKATAAST